MRDRLRAWWRRKLFDYAFWYLFGNEAREGSRAIFEKECDAIVESVNAYLNWQKSEQEILSERLARRFDLSTALNESASRAIDQKKVIFTAKNSLTSSQLAALAHQEEYLKNLVKKA